MKKAILMVLILISFTVYLKSGKVFKTNTSIELQDINIVYVVRFVVDGKVVFVPLVNIDYIKED
jgi:hypothetical protein